MGWMAVISVVMYLIERIATLVGQLVPAVVSGLISVAYLTLRVTLFLLRRFLEWLEWQVPELSVCALWYRRAAASALLVPAVVWAACRIIGLSTSLLLVALLALSGFLLGALADEDCGEWDWGSDQDDSFPLNL
jgi:hypothetical protein